MDKMKFKGNLFGWCLGYQVAKNRKWEANGARIWFGVFTVDGLNGPGLIIGPLLFGIFSMQKEL